MGREVSSTVLSGCSRPSSRAISVALRFVNLILPVFFTVTNALVTSPIPWVTSMLVLHPSTSTLMDGVGAATVAEGVSERNTSGVSVIAGSGVLFGMGVDVAITGVG